MSRAIPWSWPVVAEQEGCVVVVRVEKVKVVYAAVRRVVCLARE
jgi:hypothetical protein